MYGCICVSHSIRSISLSLLGLTVLADMVAMESLACLRIKECVFSYSAALLSDSTCKSSNFHAVFFFFLKSIHQFVFISRSQLVSKQMLAWISRQSNHYNLAAVKHKVIMGSSIGLNSFFLKSPPNVQADAKCGVNSRPCQVPFYPHLIGINLSLYPPQPIINLYDQTESTALYLKYLTSPSSNLMKTPALKLPINLLHQT